MKKTGLAVLGMVVAVFVAGCGSTGTVSPAPTSTPTSQATSAKDSKASIDPKTVDYSKVDYTIAYGDSSTMSSIAAAVWFGEYDGKVVKVDGIAEKLGGWSIMEEAGDGVKIGFGFELVGSTDYPADGTRVELLGVIAPGGTMEGSRVLYVLPENFKIPVSDTQAYKQFGNSVAIPAIQATAEKELKLLGII